MLIRHGEKPADTPPPYGVTLGGEQDKESLTPRGWQRAGALVAFFAPNDNHFQDSHIATPQTIYASQITPHSASQRLDQTITPLLEKLGARAQANFTFPKDATQNMVLSVLECDGIVLVCWDHKDLANLAHQIPISPNNPTPVPAAWDGERFDLVWVFDLDPATKSYLFTPVPQLLLAGDQPV